MALEFSDDELELFESINSDAPASPAAGPLSASAAVQSANFKGKHMQIVWKRGRLLGSGAFGKVYLGARFDLRTPDVMAVKVVEFSMDDSRAEAVAKQVRDVEREIELLNRLGDCVNIVQYFGAQRSAENSLNIFMEFVGCGSLAGLLARPTGPNGRRGLDEQTTRAYTYQLLQGLGFLHEKRVVHRDLKAANVLISKQPSFPCLHTLKIADFGTSTLVSALAAGDNADSRSLAGTPNFMAPEVIRQTGHDFKADIWSTGCVLVEMLTGAPPWAKMEAMAILFMIGTHGKAPPLPDGLSPLLLDFFSHCFDADPVKRWRVHQLARHDWLDNMQQLPEDSMDATVVAATKIGDDVAAEIDALIASGSVTRNYKFSEHAAAHSKIDAWDERPLKKSAAVQEYFDALMASAGSGPEMAKAVAIEDELNQSRAVAAAAAAADADVSGNPGYEPGSVSLYPKDATVEVIVANERLTEGPLRRDVSTSRSSLRRDEGGSSPKS